MQTREADEKNLSIVETAPGGPERERKPGNSEISDFS
jgi:hypothetical protein